MPPEWRRAADRAPVTSETVNYLRHCMSGVSPAAQDFRILLVTSLILDAFWKADTVRSDGIAASLLISTALDMSCAAIQCAESEAPRSEEHTSELQSLMRISYAVFCLKKKTNTT